MAPAETDDNDNATLSQPDFRITSALLYHPDLGNVDENTALSGNGEPCLFYMFTLHQRRIIAAINDLPGNTEPMLETISGSPGLERMRQAALRVAGAKPAKMRFTLDREGLLDCTSLNLGNDNLAFVHEDYFPNILLDPVQIEEEAITWRVGIHCQSIKAQFTTRHKTTMREHYALAMKDAPNPEGDHRMEVLVVNYDNQIMEGCSTTPYFWRNGHWVTPHADCGGNLGTTRRWALEKQLVSETIIMWEEVHLGEIILLSNGVRGFGFGKVVKA